MPELPEVETVVRHLRPQLVGQGVTGFTAHWAKVTAPATPDEFARQVVGRRIEAVDRRGKFILLGLKHGLVHIHLRMTGRLQVTPTGARAAPAHVSAIFELSSGGQLVFRDARKFGRIGYLDSSAALDESLGPEPLSEAFSPQRFRRMLAGRRRQIKPLLLDQAFIAGLGNIYVDEALFQARIHPLTRAHRLSPRKATALHRAIRRTLQASIDRQGTTIINFGFGNGQVGSFRDQLRVFGRQGEPCPVCGAGIVKTRVAQRGTHLCPRCQRLRAPRKA